MIVDVTGVVLIPGEGGKNCPGNGRTYDEKGKKIECCCDECDYMQCCFPEYSIQDCLSCEDPDCPHSKKRLG